MERLLGIPQHESQGSESDPGNELPAIEETIGTGGSEVSLDRSR